jgi:hypothetical protein
MKKSLAIALMGVSMLAVSAIPAQAAVPAATYSFDMNGAFTDSIGTSTITGAVTCNSPSPSDLCNVESNFGSDSHGHFWHWRTTQPLGGGAVFDTPADIGPTYSLYLRFAIDDEANDLDSNSCTDQFNNNSKIADFRNQATDVGLYAVGCDPLYTAQSISWAEPAFDRGEVVGVVAARSDTTKSFTVFVITGGLCVDASGMYDVSGDYIPADQGSGSRVRLFQDDGTDAGTPSNEGVQEGRLYGVKVWKDMVMTLDQCNELFATNGGSNGGSKENLAYTGGNAAVVGWMLGLAAIAGCGAFLLRRRNS